MRIKKRPLRSGEGVIFMLLKNQSWSRRLMVLV